MNRPIYYFGCQDLDTDIEKQICIVPLHKQNNTNVLLDMDCVIDLGPMNEDLLFNY